MNFLGGPQCPLTTEMLNCYYGQSPDMGQSSLVNPTRLQQSFCSRKFYGVEHLHSITQQQTKGMVSLLNFELGTRCIVHSGDESIPSPVSVLLGSHSESGRRDHTKVNL
jgi:hypothetical protein